MALLAIDGMILTHAKIDKTMNIVPAGESASETREVASDAAELQQQEEDPSKESRLALPHVGNQPDEMSAVF